LVDGTVPALALVAVAGLATGLGDPSSVPMWLIFLVVVVVGVFQAVRRRSWGESVIFSVLSAIICGVMFAVSGLLIGGGGWFDLVIAAAGVLVAGMYVILLPGMVALGRLIHLGASAVWGRRRVPVEPEG